MKLRILVNLVFIVFAVSGFAQAKVTGAKSQNNPARRNRAFEAVTDDPNLPRVLLIGDSISIGYTVPVRALLKGKANVHRNAGNGGPTTNGLAHLKQWLGDSKWDVIHFNWGLHDLKFMPDGKRQVDTKAYEKNLRELVQQLKATGAKLIWATTTPVPEGVTPPRKNEDVLAYNAIARKIMEENQVAVDDLYSFALPRLAEIQQRANVHYTPQGYAALAKPVAASIESALGGKK
jgi:lysophospholipase L1-like esterase